MEEIWDDTYGNISWRIDSILVSIYVVTYKGIKGRMIYFSADHHFGHVNIIGYCNRRFSSIEEMDKNLIDIWNATVKLEDIVYYLGDFHLGKNPQNYFATLNGTIAILDDNTHHDKYWLNSRTYGTKSDGYSTRSGAVEYLPPLYTFVPHDVPITLCHFPMESWNRSHYNSWHLHGHIHLLGDSFRKKKMLDVGIDNANALLGEYRPFSLTEVEERMKVR